MPRISRRNLLTVGGTAVLGSLAGCSGDDDGSDGTTDGSDDGSDGTTDGSDGSDDGDSEPITLGLLLPSQLPGATDMEQGLEYAVQVRNSDGGVMGRQVEYLVGDTQLEPQTAVSEARRLVSSENVDFLIGGFSSEATLAVQQEIAGEGPVFMSTSASAGSLSERVGEQPEEFKYWFSTAPRGPQQFDMVAQLVRDVILPQTGYTTLATPAEDLAWTSGYSDRVASNLGSDIQVEPFRYQFDTGDFSSLFSRAQDADADMLVPIVATADGVAFVNQWADAEVELPMAGLVAVAGNENFPDQVGEGGAISVGSILVGAEAPLTDHTMTFVEGYRSEFEVAPDTQTWTTYDGAKTLFDAIEEAGTTDADAIVETLRGGTYTGAMGTVEFQGLDDEFPHSIRIAPEYVYSTLKQWQETDDGLENVLLGPETVADSDGEQDWILPTWMQ